MITFNLFVRSYDINIEFSIHFGPPGKEILVSNIFFWFGQSLYKSAKLQLCTTSRSEWNIQTLTFIGSAFFFNSGFRLVFKSPETPNNDSYLNLTAILVKHCVFRPTFRNHRFENFRVSDFFLWFRLSRYKSDIF
jgi:hypothetical protein